MWVGKLIFLLVLMFEVILAVVHGCLPSGTVKWGTVLLMGTRESLQR